MKGRAWNAREGREGTFAPLLIPKLARRLAGVDDTVLAIYGSAAGARARARRSALHELIESMETE